MHVEGVQPGYCYYRGRILGKGQTLLGFQPSVCIPSLGRVGPSLGLHTTPERVPREQLALLWTAL